MVLVRIFCHVCGCGCARAVRTLPLKEGCPLSPALFMLHHGAFHRTLREEFGDVKVFVYVYGMAVVKTSRTGFGR